jgi:hypothetical protein
VALRPNAIRNSPNNYLAYFVFVLSVACAITIANVTNQNFKIFALSMMFIDISVATYLHSTLALKWSYGLLFNLLGCGFAVYEFYPMFHHQANLFYASLIGSLIYGNYLLFKVFSILTKKRSAFSGLTKDDYLIGTVAMYIDPLFLGMVIIQGCVGYTVYHLLPETPIVPNK